MKPQILHTIDTEYSADSIEWCPCEEYQSFFVCGTYQLEENKSTTELSAPCKRKGRIYLYHFDSSSEEIKEMFRVETAAILDMKWLTHLDIPLLTSANAIGEIEIYQLEDNSLKKIITEELNPEDEDLLALSLDWNHKTKQICVSDSKGGVTLFKYDNGSLLKESHWSAHNFEAWICAFDDWNQNLLYTGGDDTLFHCFDIRCPKEAFKTLTNKSHGAGVTCFLSHPSKENFLLSGSYDENLRLFDTRSLKKPVGEVNLAGGIWRIKSNPFDENMILTACMYNNFSVVKILEDSSLKLGGVLETHKSICYGSDWSHDKNKGGEGFYTATCSFYDHKLCLSKWEV
ncbi:DPH7 family protein [Megaselia abdita]